MKQLLGYAESLLPKKTPFHEWLYGSKDFLDVEDVKKTSSERSFNNLKAPHFRLGNRKINAHPYLLGSGRNGIKPFPPSDASPSFPVNWIRRRAFLPDRGSNRLRRRYRVQFAIWTFVTLSAFVYVLVMTFATDSLNPESLVLIGISGAMAVGAVSIQKSATGIASQQGLLSDLDIANQAEFNELREKVRAGERNVVKLKRTIASLKQKLQRVGAGAELKKKA
ncbi:hypothetical protein [Caballeronia sp. 15711]|uniref:hypothetical protein n=1 Tax=Caballeronia sp. 15711 TaxID=3391029 RepID=UPI0039E2800D